MLPPLHALRSHDAAPAPPDAGVSRGGSRGTSSARKVVSSSNRVRSPGDLGGYQKRANTLRQKIGEASTALEKADQSLDSFRTLQISEEAAISRRLESLRAEVGFVAKREREAQDLYRERKEELLNLTGVTTNGYH